MSEKAVCKICGEPMPPGEEVFFYHGYSGPCPKPPLLEPWQSRVVNEKEELDAKISKLGDFLNGGTDISELERSNLYRQLRVMNEYSEILGERIKNFGKVVK